MPVLTVFTQAFTEKLQAAVSANVNRYQEDNSWVVDWAGKEPWQFTTACQITGPIKLKLCEDKELYDLENAIRLHKALSHLTPIQAQDSRLWAKLCHVDLWEYMRSRWPVEKYLDKPDKVPARLLGQYFVAQRQSRALIRNGAARLWWSAKLTFDPSRANNYELTGVLLKSLDIAKNLLERNFGRIPSLAKTFLEFLNEHKDECLVPGNASRLMVRHLTKSLNLHGGICLLDSLTKKETLNFLNIERKKVLAGVISDSEEVEDEDEEG